MPEQPESAAEGGAAAEEAQAEAPSQEKVPVEGEAPAEVEAPAEDGGEEEASAQAEGGEGGQAAHQEGVENGVEAAPTGKADLAEMEAPAGDESAVLDESAAPDESAALDDSAAMEGGQEHAGASQDGQGFEHAFDGTRMLPDAREIEVDIGNGAPPVVISLTIEHDIQRKPYYGGYRHKLTGVEYHHATCQTEVPPKPKRKTEDMAPPKFHRETQTRKIKEQAQQAVREFGTQMTREDHFVEARDDYMIEPRDYLDSEHYAKTRLAATIVVQCYTRGMFARKLARQSRAQLVWNRQYYLDQQVRERREREAQREREVERRMHPKNGADFEILYNELEEWRVAETQKIETGGLDEEERQVRQQQREYVGWIVWCGYGCVLLVSFSKNICVVLTCIAFRRRHDMSCFSRR